MREKADRLGRETITRRQVLAGAAIAALAAGSPSVLAASRPRQVRRSGSPVPVTGPGPRYMAASATLGDGRILVTGGYSRPWNAASTPTPSSSAMIFDPRNGSWTQVAPMNLGRARHAAVSMSDGRVAVLGGLAMNPTASVEIYDPQTNTWSMGRPLGQPRYDHTASTAGTTVYLIGGSSLGMLTTTETYQVQEVLPSQI